MDCVFYCTLALASALMPDPNIQSCNYCLNVRGITTTCDYDIVDCVQKHPDMVLYCLTVNAVTFDGGIRRILRCRPFSAFNTTIDTLHQVRAMPSCDDFSAAKSCDCDTCPTRITTTTSLAPGYVQTKNTRRPHQNREKSKSTLSGDSKYMPLITITSQDDSAVKLSSLTQKNDVVYVISGGSLLRLSAIQLACTFLISCYATTFFSGVL